MSYEFKPMDAETHLEPIVHLDSFGGSGNVQDRQQRCGGEVDVVLDREYLARVRAFVPDDDLVAGLGVGDVNCSRCVSGVATSRLLHSPSGVAASSPIVKTSCVSGIYGSR